MRVVPARWMDYQSFGKVIKGTKILAFKVPLKLTAVKNLLPEQQFTTALLMNAVPNLKFVIDLTNTTRYYSQTEFTNAGVQYEKIMVMGKKVPCQSDVEKFFWAMDKFYSTAKEGEIIGVHCTHGLNRTGYLVCRYLVQQLGWDLKDAVKEFEEARGHPIERDEYKESLKQVPRNQKIDTSKIKVNEMSQTKTTQGTSWRKPLIAQRNPRKHFQPMPEFNPADRRGNSEPTRYIPSQKRPAFTRQTNTDPNYERFPKIRHEYRNNHQEIRPYNHMNRHLELPAAPEPWRVPIPIFNGIPDRAGPPPPPQFHDPRFSSRSVPYQPPKIGIPSSSRPVFPRRNRPPTMPVSMAHHGAPFRHQTQRNIHRMPYTSFVRRQNDFTADNYENNFCEGSSSFQRRERR